MNIKKQHFFQGLFSIVLLLLCSCANQIPPSGGPKDNTPPKVEGTSPLQEKTQYSGEPIVLLFDEYIQLDKSLGKIITSPYIKELQTSVKGKKIIVQIDEELKKETTYLIHFNEAIKDYREGNVLSDMMYVFSTGSQIDTLSIRGKIIHAYDKAPQEEVYAFLYSDRNNLLKNNPLYMSKTNSTGDFYIPYIKEGTYYLAAIKDNNFSLTYDQNNESIGFFDEVIVPSVDSNKTIELRLFEEETTQHTSEEMLYIAKEMYQGKPIMIRSAQEISQVMSEKLVLLDSMGNEIPIVLEVKEDQKTLQSLEGIAQPGQYTMIIKDEFIVYADSGKNDSMHWSLSVLDTSYASTMHLLFAKDNVYSNQQLVAELVNEDNQIIQTKPIQEGDRYTLEWLTSGIYYVRIYEDQNNNQQWDTGDVETMTQPEKTLFFSEKIEIKQGWDYDLEINW